MKRIIPSLALIAVAAACSPLEPETSTMTEDTPLQVSVSNAAVVASRGIIRSTSLADGSEIGLTLYDISGTSYQGADCENRCYTASGTGSSQTWESESPIMVSNTPGTLYGYYPYSSSADRIDAIAVRADSDNQTDWMYAEPVEA